MILGTKNVLKPYLRESYIWESHMDKIVCSQLFAKYFICAGSSNLERRSSFAQQEGFELPQRGVKPYAPCQGTAKSPPLDNTFSTSCAVLFAIKTQQLGKKGEALFSLPIGKMF